MRVYVAGKYSSDNILGVLSNIRDGIDASAKILKLGHAVFCPWLDHQFHFFDSSLTVKEYQLNSMAWLEVSDVVVVLPNSENSKGTQAEIVRAKELGIKVIDFKDFINAKNIN
jgi:hypothetical protein